MFLFNKVTILLHILAAAASSDNWFEGIVSTIFVWSADVTETAPTGGNVGDVYVGASVNIPSYHVSKQISSQEKSTKMLRGYTPFVYSSVPGWFRADYSNISGESLVIQIAIGRHRAIGIDSETDRCDWGNAPAG